MSNALQSHVLITLNGLPVEATVGETVLSVLSREQIAIPSLCCDPSSGADGNCRSCLVEVSGFKTLQPSCLCQVSGQMEITTHSERAERVRRRRQNHSPQRIDRRTRKPRAKPTRPNTSAAPSMISIPSPMERVDVGEARVFGIREIVQPFEAVRTFALDEHDGARRTLSHHLVSREQGATCELLTGVRSRATAPLKRRGGRIAHRAELDRRLAEHV